LRRSHRIVHRPTALLKKASADLKTRSGRLAERRAVGSLPEVRMPDFPPTSVGRTPADLKTRGDRERSDVLWERPDRVVILEGGASTGMRRARCVR